MTTNKNLKNILKETANPSSQQLKELAQSLSNTNVAQKLKQTHSALTNPGKEPTNPTTSVNKASHIGSGNTLLEGMQSGGGTSRAYGANTSGFDNLVETWEKDKTAQERINRQQAQSVNAIGSTNTQTNNILGGSPRDLSALNQALATYFRSASAKEPTTASETKSTVLNTTSFVEPSTVAAKGPGATTTKPADGLHYDASDGSYTRMVNGNPYKVTYKDSGYGAIRNEYNKTHSTNITYDMDSKGVITKYVNDIPYMIRPDDARYDRVANEFLAANIGDKTDQGIRDLAKKYPALQVNWWDNGGDDTITIGLQNTREPLITLTDEYEDGTYTSTNGIITCKLKKGGSYVVAAQPTTSTTNETNTSFDRYTNRPTTASRDGSIEWERIAAVNGTGMSEMDRTTTASGATIQMDSSSHGITKTYSGGEFTVTTDNKSSYEMMFSALLGIDSENLAGQSLKEIVRNKITNGNVVYNPSDKSVNITQNGDVLITLAYDPISNSWVSKNRKIICKTDLTH